MRYLSYTVLLCSMLTPHADAALRMPKIFTSHMVLQQKHPIVIWGWADPGENVTVTLSQSSASATADANGYWTVTMPAQNADGVARTLTIKSKETVELTDVLLGEVWLCGGQSNMGRPVSEETIKGANQPLIRLFNSSGEIPRRDDMDDASGWRVCSPTVIATAGDALGPSKPGQRRAFSEVAYHFGLKLQQALKVPIGLIQVNCGGSTALDWTPLPEAEKKIVYDQPIQKITHSAGLLYWVRMRTWVALPVRGAIWYQGEDDGRNPKYGEDLKNLIESWRRERREPIPFYIAQIAPTTYSGGMLGVWEGEVKVVNTVPDTALAVSNDIYDGTPNNEFKERIDQATGWPIVGSSNPHPTGRPLVAGRLADIALVKTYNQPEKTITGPIFDSIQLHGKKAVVKFKNAGSGLETRDGKDPDWFEVSDGSIEKGKLVYLKAAASISGNDSVEVASSGADIKYVRFGWHTLARFNLTNKEHFPAVSFRTDAQSNFNR